MNKMIFILAVASILFPTVFINAQECSEREMMEMMSRLFRVGNL